MARVTGSYGRPVHGVSQLPDTSKLIGQCREQLNCVPDLVDGLRKRQGTRHVVNLLESIDPLSYVHMYTRDESETYIIILEPNAVEFQVYDLAGNKMIVNHEASAYHQVDNPYGQIQMKTISDFTFIVNNQKVVSYTDDVTTNENDNIAIVEVKFATYGRTYTIYVDGTPLTYYEAPTGETASDIDLVDTSYVAQKLSEGTVTVPVTETHTVEFSPTLNSYIITVNELANTVSSVKTTGLANVGINVLGFDGSVIRLQNGGKGGVNSGMVVKATYVPQGGGDNWEEYEISRTVNTLYIRRIDGEPFSIDTEDGVDGEDLVSVLTTITNVSKLPTRAPIGFKVRVSNSSQDKSDDYWLISTTDEDNEGETLWTEGTDDGLNNKFDLTTMPHVMVRESITDGIATFTYRQGEWEDRRVGSLLNNPDPSFVGSTINGIGTFQNRLFLVNDDIVNMTRTEKFFDFFRYTAKVDRDDDPIQKGTDSDRVDKLSRYSYLQGDIIFFSTFAQYHLFGGEVITNENVQLKQVNAYPNNPEIAPADIGNALIFSVEAGEYTGFRQYEVNGDTSIREALNITDHVSKYIPKNLKILESSPTTDILIAYSEETPEDLYIYNWKVDRSEGLVQQAWHKWRMHGIERVFKVYMLLDYMYLIVQRAEGIFIESMSLQSDVPEDGLPYTLRLDRRHTTTAERYGFRWMFDIDFELDDITRLQVIKGTGTWDEELGAGIPVTKETVFIEGEELIRYFTTDELAEGDTCELVVGLLYDSTYIPPSPRVIDGNGRPSEMERLQVAKMHIGYELTGSLEFIVRDSYRQSEYSSSFNGRKMGAPNNKVGFAKFMSGTWSVPVRHEATYLEVELRANGFLPFNIKHIEWEGTHTQRGRRY